MKRRDLLKLSSAALAFGGCAAWAKVDVPLRIVVPYPAGGTTDILGRAMTDSLSKSLGRTVLVDNRPGAGGVIAAQFVRRSAPDGSALLFTNEGFVLAALLQKVRPYDPMRDFSPVSAVGMTSTFVVVNAGIPVTSVAELIAYARKLPDGIEAGNVGLASIGYLQTLRFQRRAGIKVLHVPYKGTSEMASALIGGEIKMEITAMTDAIIAQAQAGKVRILASTAPTRMSFAADIPCLHETLPGFIEWGWFGLLTTAGTPASYVGQLNAAVQKAMSEPGVRERFHAAKLEPLESSASRFSGMLGDSMSRFSEVIAQEQIPLS